ncbi:MAG: PilX N-terminal domain-containing pilus assembly protein [Gammaproteobacteria bacterium]
MNTSTPATGHKQRGAALFMALIFLLIMTILGVFGMNLSRMENLMAGNNQFQTLALNHAELMLEAGLRDVEDNIGPPYIDPDASGDHIYMNMIGSSETIDPTAINWTFNTVSTTPTGGDAKYSYDYAIEYIGTLDGTENALCSAQTGTGGTLDDCLREIYLVTSQSVTSRGAKRVIQSVFVSGDQM